MFLETPLALWLFPAGVVALLLLQLWQARRRELLVGSLFVWRRVAEKERARPRRRLILDRSFWLQAATLLALALAWANPNWQGHSAPGRSLVVFVDNGPSSRARQVDGKPVWDRVRSAAREFLAGLNADDRVILCTTVPFSRHLPSNEGSTPQRAIEELETVSPGLTTADPEELWRFALEEARLWPGKGNHVRSLVFSPRAAPKEAEDHSLANWVTVPAGNTADNVALTAFGLKSPFDPGPAELLVQVRNFGLTKVSGRVACEANGGSPIPTQRVELAPGGVKGVVFMPGAFDRSFRVSWTSDAGTDALPEDDQVSIVPRNFGPPRVRWHGAAPHLQDLYRQALGAQELALDAREPADLDVFVESLPPAPAANSNAVLLLAPPSDLFPFEVQAGTLERPVARLGREHPLTRGLAETATGLDWPIATARAIRPVGDMHILAQDQKGNLLAGRFLLRSAQTVRPLQKPEAMGEEPAGYVFAFVPGEGLNWAPERKFDSPGLATVLLRLLREACGAERPFNLQNAEQLERLAGKPLPLDWRPAFDEKNRAGQGVLNARASAVPAATSSTAPVNTGTLAPAATPERHPLWWLFVLLAVVLILVEVRVETRAATAAVTPVAV